MEEMLEEKGKVGGTESPSLGWGSHSIVPPAFHVPFTSFPTSDRSPWLLCGEGMWEREQK